jgi:membrane protein
LRRAVVAALDDGCFSIAKSVAFSALLSFFPVLASAATILVQTRAELVSRMLQHALSQIVPPGSEQLIVTQFQVKGARPWGVLLVAGIIAIWGAAGVIKSLIDGFHAAYKVPRDRGILRQQAVAMTLVLACAVPLLAASLLIVFGGSLERAIVNWMNVDPLLSTWSGAWKWVSLVTRYIVAFTTTAVVAAVLYYFGPYREQHWRYVWPGAILTTALWLLATSAFGWYASNFAHYNVMYGSISAGIALLVWMYVMAFVALIGCEFNAEFERSAVLSRRALE